MPPDAVSRCLAPGGGGATLLILIRNWERSPHILQAANLGGTVPIGLSPMERAPKEKPNSKGTGVPVLSGRILAAFWIGCCHEGASHPESGGVINSPPLGARLAPGRRLSPEG